MRVLLADKLPDSARARLADAGCEVRAEPGLKGAELAEHLRSFDPDVLVVRSTRVEPEHLEAARSLSLVVRAGAGVNTIALDDCARRGVYVANCPGRNAIAVAELALGLVVSLDRHIPDAVAELRAGRWDKARFSKAQGLAGRTLGILGMGDIGREVAVRARAFGMDVVAWSRSLTESRAAELGVRRCERPEDVARSCDVLSVHLALTPETRGLVGESVFSALPDGALFVNTSRAEVVDDAALLRALDRGVRAGLDVFAGEPSGKTGAFEDPVGLHPNVYGTHHVGASTEQAQQAVADEACRVVEVYKQQGRVPNCVNLARTSGADHMLVVRHADRVGVLAAVLDRLSRAELNVEEMENIVFDGGEAAVARIQVHGRPTADVLDDLSGHAHVFAVSVVPV